MLFENIIFSVGSAKNFYCCRSCVPVCLLIPFGSAKNFYCCRLIGFGTPVTPLEVLRISTVVDWTCPLVTVPPLEVLRISTVVDPF